MTLIILSEVQNTHKLTKEMHIYMVKSHYMFVYLMLYAHELKWHGDKF